MTDPERFVEHLLRITGRSEDVIRRVESSVPNLPHIYVFVHRDWPHPGFITGFTFGLSAARHPDWKHGKPELMISVESSDEIWLFAMGHTAEQMRGVCPFCYGDTIDVHRKISKESDLDAFLVFGPPFLQKEETSVQLTKYTCQIAGLYPMYSSEIALYEEIGLENFWHLPGWKPFDVHRAPMTEAS